MANPIRTVIKRMTAARLPIQEEIESFGSKGEERICRLLYQSFDCVLRNVIVPYKELYLEKDFLVIERGVPFVLEIKNWKGEIVSDGSFFYQNKANGVQKKMKSPVGTTNQFIREWKRFYGLESPVIGVVVFAEPECTLSLPPESDGVALLRAEKLVSFIRSRARTLAAQKATELVPEPSRILRCTRLYSRDSEFCKGLLTDVYLELTDENGRRVRLDTTQLRYLTVEHLPLSFKDKIYVTFVGGATGVFYNRDAILTVGCLDGSFRKFALHRIHHIVF